MEKEEWIRRAEEKIKPFMGDNAREYAEGLYETYDGADGICGPEDAVDEDMTYWGD